jgi:hypothetical protein
VHFRQNNRLGTAFSGAFFARFLIEKRPKKSDFRARSRFLHYKAAKNEVWRAFFSAKKEVAQKKKKKKKNQR